MKCMSARCCVAFIAALLATTTALAEVETPQEFDKIIQQRGQVGALTDGYFGDQISLSIGGLEIIQTDVGLPGNNALPVRAGRRLVAGKGLYGVGHFDKWDLDIPNLHGVFFGGVVTGHGWLVVATNATDSLKRCSLFGSPMDINYQGGIWSPDEYWYGNSFYLPGNGDHELLERSASAHVPNDGNTYPIVTKEGAAVRCLATLDSGSGGEGFEVVTPDGAIYTMNHMVSRRIEGLTKSSPMPEFLIVGGVQTSNSSMRYATKSGVQPSVAVNYILPRDEVLIYPTQVRDRFGNTVTYTWSDTNPWRLLQIVASDGRHLDFTYPQDDADSYQVTSISDGSRVWTYSAYQMTQPDGKSWAWGVNGLHDITPLPFSVYCDAIRNPNLSRTTTGWISGPSGARVDYTLTATLFGRSWMYRNCISNIEDNGELRPLDPYLFEGMAITGKKITGPGLPVSGLSWTYAYGSPNHCWNPDGATPASPEMAVCDALSPTTRVVSATAPDGAVTLHIFGNRFRVNEGLLLKQEFGWNGTAALKTVSYDYADPEAAPYAAYNGISWRNRGDYDITRLVRPRRQVTTVQQGRTFTWKVATGCSGVPYCFDTFARPTTVTRSSAPSP